MKNYELPIFTTAHEASLASRVKDNRDRYVQKSSWAAGNPSKTCILSGIMVPENSGSILDPSPQKDAENAIKLHKALNLTPREASRPTLWSRLTHVEMWDYMRSRWNATGKNISFVRNRYFVMQSNSRPLMRNGIARLWWAAQLTRSDRDYHHTSLLISMPEIAERSYARSPTILQTILEFIDGKTVKKHESDKIVTAGARDDFRILLRRLNELGGTALLVELNKDEIKSFLEKTDTQIQKEKKSGKPVA
jgi:hypothetical protein